jgi:hypothetical protein
MSSFSDEPILVKPTVRGAWKRRVAIAFALIVTGSVLYIPYDKARMEELAHDAKRGPRQGAVYEISVDGASHTLELSWMKGGFAPVLTPAPAEGVTLLVQATPGTEGLRWNPEAQCFGPGSVRVDPYAHYKLKLRLEKEGRTLWRDTLWALGVHDSHGHGH